MRKIIAFGLLALLIYAVSQSPEAWATATQHGGGHIADIANGVGRFFTNLAT